MRPSTNVAICGFVICGPNIFLQFGHLQFSDLIFADLKLSQVRNSPLINIDLKDDLIKIYTTKSAIGFAKLFKEVFHPLFSMVKNLKIPIRPAHIRICGLI
jgi:hypothetical protein